MLTPNNTIDTTNTILSIIPITPVIIPAIDIPLLLDFKPIIPSINAIIPQGIDTYHIQQSTIAIIPNTNAAIENPFLSFVAVVLVDWFTSLSTLFTSFHFAFRP